ncbi:restriction endonuclease subunit S [Agrobacterium fabacearum]|nr:restriction endonuclease subunit S [Agrobacterium tumefaciens]
MKTTIGALCDQYGGSVQTGPFGGQLHASDYSLEGIPVVMPQDLVDGRVSVAKVARVQPEHVNRLQKHKLQAGDIVFSRRGDVGRFASISDNEAGWLCGTGCIRIRLNCPDVDIRYVRQFLARSETSDWLFFNAKGVTMANLNTDIVRSLPLVFPPLDEQKRIAAILDKADALRAKRRQAIALLESLTQSIFLEMFGDPVSNPNGYPLLNVEELSEKYSDGPFGSNLKSEHYTDDGMRVIRLQNIGVGCFINDDAAYISPEHFQRLEKHECRPGDVLIATLGDPNLRACIQPDWLELALNKADCVQLRVNSTVATAEYCAALLNVASARGLAESLVLGQTRGRISMGRLRDLRLPVAPLEKQQAFSLKMKRLEMQKQRSEHLLCVSESFFASLQHRAFTGQL